MWFEEVLGRMEETTTVKGLAEVVKSVEEKERGTEMTTERRKERIECTKEAPIRRVRKKFEEQVEKKVKRTL